MRYHEWILQELRKEREMQQLPLDLPPVEGELFGFFPKEGMTTCAWCDKPIKQADVVPYQDEHFCSEDHMNEHMLNQIRCGGL
jgi:hypothetical protein